jgi:hypothetical protein
VHRPEDRLSTFRHMSVGLVETVHNVHVPTANDPSKIRSLKCFFTQTKSFGQETATATRKMAKIVGTSISVGEVDFLGN